MAEPAEIGFKERAEVGDAVFQHGDAVEPHAEGKALPLIGIETAGPDHSGMHHSRSEDLEPAVAGADPDLTAFPGAVDVDLHRGLGEGEMRGAEPHPDLIELEERLAELLEAPFEMAEGEVAVERQPLDLV